MKRASEQSEALESASNGSGLCNNSRCTYLYEVPRTIEESRNLAPSSLNVLNLPWRDIREHLATVERVERAPRAPFSSPFLCTSSPESRSALHRRRHHPSSSLYSSPSALLLSSLLSSLLSALDRHIMLYLFAIWTGNPGNKGAATIADRALSRLVLLLGTDGRLSSKWSCQIDTTFGPKI